MFFNNKTTMFIARKQELDNLKHLLEKPKSSFLAVYGRRRIGKTETIRHFCNINKIKKIEYSGKVDQTKAQLIKSFIRYIERISDKKVKEPIKDWNSAFYVLTDYLERQTKHNKIVVFFDELPWIDTAKSGFLGELAEFWNGFCTQRSDIVLIVCGSAASYMHKKVIHNRGSLHGRITDIMPMQQFDLHASKQMLVAQGCKYSDKTIVDTYMILGGVAKYLESIDSRLTLAQSIDKLCFQNEGLLKYEYQDLFASLFNNSQTHYNIMSTLTNKWSGYTQQNLVKLVKISSVNLKKPLQELLASGFISATTKFNQTKRDVIYRAKDCFSYFYNKWMKDKSTTNWNHTVNSQSYKSWAGFAFENICHMHSEQIKKVLGISGVPTKSHYWQYTAKDSNEKGAQIDLLLEHTNGSKCIDIIECKYYNDAYIITKSYRQELLNKINIFNQQTKYKYNIRLIFITVHGMKKNEYYHELVSQDICIGDMMY